MPTYAARAARSALLGVLLAVQTVALGQTRETGGIPDLSTLKGDLKTQTRTPELRPAVPMDAPLNASEYYVGPGDELSLNIWSVSPVEQRLVVTPEGSLLIPNVGRVVIGDATLDSLQRKVVRQVGKRYLNADISLTLLSPRKVVVQISGYILNEGRKEVYATQRVDDLIALSSTFPADKLSVPEYSAEMRRLYNDASQRRIVLKRRDGQTIPVDLVRYRATGKGKFNPYLKEGDVVFVPQRTMRDVQIGVYGAVMNAANFEFVRGDSLSSLAAMALGFKERSDPEHAVLTRLTPDGSEMDTVNVNALAVMQGKDPDIALRPGDRLIIPAIPEERLDYHVALLGEVTRPGDYPITRRTTTLAGLLREAGGVTPMANLHAATILRLRGGESSSPEQPQSEDLLSRRSSLSVQDTAYYNVETALRLQGELVSVDFAKLLQGDSTQDVPLHPFDRITIPPLSGTIYVFGQVVHPGHVPLVEGKDFSYYVDRSGGFTGEARSGDAQVIKGGTHIWLAPSETKMEDGDFIWVPKEPQYPFSYYVTTYSQIAGILGAIATIALLVKSF